jgi:hypothetical protein
VTATAASAVGLFVMARASATSLPYHDAGGSRLRLSWSARPERIEGCHQVSAEELAREEEHMRQRIVCEGSFATYTLRVEADGRALDETVVRGSGLRHDRPLHLLRDFDMPIGAHRVRVSFTRRERVDGDRTAGSTQGETKSDTGLFAGRAEREQVERRRRAGAAIPARLRLDTVVVFNPGRVAVITFDPDRRALALLDREPASR